MSKKSGKYFLLILLCSIFFVSLLPAQQQPTPTDNVVKHGLSDLKEKLDFLKEISKQYPDPRLEKLIQQIERHLQNANQANQLKQNRKAAIELSIARNLVNEALKIVVSGPATRLLEQVNEQIRYVEEALQRNFHPQAQKILADAKQSLNRALSAKRQNVQKMIEWLRVALTQAKTAHKLISSPGSNVDIQSAIHEEKSNYDDLLPRAQNMLQQNRGSMSQQLLNQAISQQRKAENAISRGNYQQAVESYRWASRLLLRVIDLSAVSEVNLQRRASEELRITRDQLRSIEQSENLDRFPRLRKLYQQATKVYLDAEHSFSDQNYQKTINKAETSRRILKRTSQLMSTSEENRGFNMAVGLKNIMSILGQLEKDFDPQQRPAAKFFLDTARRHQRLSQQAYRANRQFLARAHLYVATRFANGLKILLQSDTVFGNLSQHATRQFESFKSRYEDYSTRFRDTSNQDVKIWLRLAEDVLNIAETANSNGQYRILLENVKIGQQILNRIEQ